MTDKHYEPTDESHDHVGRTRHRIRATTALPRHGVREGDLGGWVGTVDNLSGDVWVSVTAAVTDSQDILVVHPIGSESAAATLTRTKGGHQLSVRCWRDRTIDQLDAEVERRSESWRGSPADHDRWRAEYQALRALCEARIEGWETR